MMRKLETGGATTSRRGMCISHIPLAACLLTACTPTPPPEPIVRTVEIRVPFDDPACAREARDRLRQEAPAYPDSDDALSRAATVFEGVQLLQAGRLLRIAREVALMGAIDACASGTARP